MHLSAVKESVTMLSHLTSQLCLELQRGKFCYVTGPRPLTRPSLCQHTCVEMTQRGYQVVRVAMPAPQNAPRTNASWDRHIIGSIWQTLHPDDRTQLTKWLETTQHLSPLARLNQFASELLLSDLCEGPFLLCLDNIDGLFNIPGALEGIMDWIACCYELRDTYLTYRHLSIVVFGSVKPVCSQLTPYLSANQQQPVFFHAPPQTTQTFKPIQKTVQRQVAFRQNFKGQNFKMLLPAFG
ncbi:MAG: hypothetical protein AAFQ95_01205 [Cyanobacteria bacterium J06621_3]